MDNLFQRHRVAAMARQLFDDLRKGLPHPESNLCILWAAAMAKALRVHGYSRAGINAGTANFRMVDPSLDDGKSPSHYSYEWDESLTFDDAVYRLVVGRHLPELHAWAVIPEAGMIVDPTTRYLPLLAATAGFEWNAAPPPAILWATAATLPDGWIYKPYEPATRLAYYVLGDQTAKVISR